MNNYFENFSMDEKFKLLRKTLSNAFQNYIPNKNNIVWLFSAYMDDWKHKKVLKRKVSMVNIYVYFLKKSSERKWSC